MKILIISILLITSVPSTAWSIESNQINVTDAEQADKAVSSLNSWEDIYNFYKKYKQFDDGSVAEGVSDSVVKMFANHWDQLQLFVKLAEKDENFFKYVTRHIDATTDDKDLEQIVNNSTNDCPESVPSSICLKIKEEANKALQEMDESDAQPSKINSVK